MYLKIAEIKSNMWDLTPTFGLKIDRSSLTVSDYFMERGINWVTGKVENADVFLQKATSSSFALPSLYSNISNILEFSGKPLITLIGESREIAPLAYVFAKKNSSFAVAPGKKFKRLFFASEWIDPMLENWNSRVDRICWFARPMPQRIEIARKLSLLGVPLDIYSKEPWPTSQWKGYSECELETSRLYRYRIVCENSLVYGYHSEKLFNSIRSGCVTFYIGSSNWDLNFLSNTFLPFNDEVLKYRQDFKDDILDGIGNFMFTPAWEVYSFRSFYDRIIDLAFLMVNSSMA